MSTSAKAFFTAMGVVAAVIFITAELYVGACGKLVPWDCIREWVSATSGWAAAIVAGITVYYLRQQLKEMTLQTKAANGDNDPLIEFLPSNPLVSGRFRITNYNRLPLKVTSVSWRIPFNAEIDEEIFDANTIPGMPQHFPKAKVDMNGNLDREITIAGWVGPDIDPPREALSLQFHIPKPHPPQQQLNQAGATLEIGFFIAGPFRRHFTKTITGPVSKLMSDD